MVCRMAEPPPTSALKQAGTGEFDGDVVGSEVVGGVGASVGTDDGDKVGPVVLGDGVVGCDVEGAAVKTQPVQVRLHAGPSGPSQVWPSISPASSRLQTSGEYSST